LWLNICFLNIKILDNVTALLGGGGVEQLRDQLRVLSKRHSMEIIGALLDGPRYISQIAAEMGIPYTTAQQRVAELERASLIEVADRVDEASKRAVREARLVNFRIELSPRIIRQLVTGEDKKEFRVA